jgi:hypothetical protein
MSASGDALGSGCCASTHPVFRVCVCVCVCVYCGLQISVLATVSASEMAVHRNSPCVLCVSCVSVHGLQISVYGMNERVGLVSFPPRQEAFDKPYSQETAHIIDQEVRGTGSCCCILFYSLHEHTELLRRQF